MSLSTNAKEEVLVLFIFTKEFNFVRLWQELCYNEIIDRRRKNESNRSK